MGFRFPWPHDVPPEMLLVLLAVVAIGGTVWGLMHWAEKRWNRDTPKNRRLPR